MAKKDGYEKLQEIVRDILKEAILQIGFILTVVLIFSALFFAVSAK